jgi:hypothetical protein
VDLEELISPLATGALKPVVVTTPIAGHLIDRCTSDSVDFLSIELPADWRNAIEPQRPANTDPSWQSFATDPVEVSAVSVAGSPTALGFVLLNDADDPTPRQLKSSAGPALPRDTLWIRREATQQSGPVSAKLFVAAYDARPGYELRVELPAPAAASCKKMDAFARALRRHLAAQPYNAFQAFATTRLNDLFAQGRTASGPGQLLPDLPDLELDTLMSLATGYDSVEAALQRHSNLRTSVETKSLTIPIAKLTAPQVAHHAWGQMLAALRSTAPEEPLARATPADFYWVRARNVGAFYDLLDEVDSWLTPAYHLMQQKSEHRLLRQRYESQLALQRADLGPAQSLIEELAVVGSDPFLIMGSDVTVILRIKSPDVLKRAALDVALAKAEQIHGKTHSTSFTHQGIAVTLAESDDRAIHRLTADVQGLTLLSNSKGGITRVIDAILGKAPRLSDELDFKYMLARDAQAKNDVLVYFGDRFIEHTIHPASRVLDARRLFAQAELARPGYAALLQGWLLGNAPKTISELTRPKLLSAQELRHFDGQAIQFEPGAAAHSSWGTLRAMTPLVDLPSPMRVSAQERDAYQRFVQNYEGLWSEKLDPVALRIRIEDGPTGPAIRTQMRVLPLVRNTDYRELEELVGDARLIPGTRSDGVRAVFGLAKDSDLKRELGSSSRGFLGRDLDINWIGSFAMLGLADRPSVANALSRSNEVPRPPQQEQERRDEFDALADLPLYAAIEVSSPSATALALAVVRKEFEGNSIQWQKPTEYHGSSVYEVRIKEADGLSIFYALGGHTLFVSLSKEVLHELLSDEQTGKSPRSAKAGTPGAQGQFVFDVAGKPNGGLLTSLAWLFEAELRRRSPEARSLAEVLFRADTKAATDASYFQRLALSYLGAVPVTADGTAYQFSERGATDPARGDAHAPVWPSLPVANSETARVFAAFAGLRTQIAFDREPSPDPNQPQTSLAVSIDLQRRR